MALGILSRSRSRRHRVWARLLWCLSACAVAASACGGDAAQDSLGGPLLIDEVATQLSIGESALISTEASRVPGINPFTDPAMPEAELQRFIAAVATLDREAECPPTLTPASLEGHVEVFRVADSCMHIEYEPLNGRSIWEAQAQLRTDPTVFAVGLPVTDLVPERAMPFDDSDLEPWHIPVVDAPLLWPVGHRERRK